MTFQEGVDCVYVPMLSNPTALIEVIRAAAKRGSKIAMSTTTSRTNDSFLKAFDTLFNKT